MDVVTSDLPQFVLSVLWNFFRSVFLKMQAGGQLVRINCVVCASITWTDDVCTKGVLHLEKCAVSFEAYAGGRLGCT